MRLRATILLLSAVQSFAGSRTFYFACTAVDASGIESDYSEEVSWTRYTGGPRTITLAWDYCDGNRVNLYWGTNSGTYFAPVDAGTNLQWTIRILPEPLTNCVVSVSASSTDMEWSFWPEGPWASMSANTWTATNAPAPQLFFRSEGATINKRYF